MNSSAPLVLFQDAPRPSTPRKPPPIPTTRGSLQTPLRRRWDFTRDYRGRLRAVAAASPPRWSRTPAAQGPFYDGCGSLTTGRILLHTFAHRHPSPHRETAAGRSPTRPPQQLAPATTTTAMPSAPRPEMRSSPPSRQGWSKAQLSVDVFAMSPVHHHRRIARV